MKGSSELPGDLSSDDELQLSPLESEILERFHHGYLAMGFPCTAELKVTFRENTGAGRYTALSHAKPIDLPDGWHGVGKYCYFKMEELFFGATYQILIENQNIKFLEIAVNGDCDWDGVERPWEIADPETGVLSGES